MAEIQSNIQPGKDSIKGGIFFGSNLTPSGTFSNVPETTALSLPAQEQVAKLTLTLEQVKEELRKNASSQAGTTTDILSDAAINTFLTTYVQLLIDHSDLRNFVFFGSAYTELSYHINYLIKNYPFKSYFAQDVVNPGIELTAFSGNRTRITFGLTDVLQVGGYAYDNSGQTIWPNFDIIDQNKTRFPILSITKGFVVTNATNTSPVIITTSNNHNLVDGDEVIISGVLGNTAANGTFFVKVTTFTATTFALYSNITLTIPIVGTGVYISGGINDRLRLIVKGNISVNNLVEFSPSVSVLYKGLIVSPKLQALSDFDTLTDPVQKELLNPTNSTPWPRTDVINNIIIEGSVFETWTSNPSNLSAGYKEDTYGLQTDGTDESNVTLSLPSAFTLDDTITNQLIRRAIPYRLIDELRDTDDKFFTRFVLLAGKMFDTIKVYIDFLKYTKELNYSPFNQLSPEFYRAYAEHYGFDLLDDESVDLAKAIIKTEPGLSYDNQNNAQFSDPDTAKTVKALQNEKQKRLLINLFFLYSKKGTLKCVETLTSLLGSPEGLIVFEEQAYNQTTGTQVVENTKIKVPQIAYEIDPDFLINPNNVSDIINLPYVYRLKLDNDNIVNLRELNGFTDPQGAIEAQVIEFGKKIYPYGYFGNGSFATLQNNNSLNPLGYYMLPLSFPDKYCGITLEYMLPRDGFPKGVGQGLDETTIHLGSLIKPDNVAYSFPSLLSLTDKIAYKMPQVFMENIAGNNDAINAPGYNFTNDTQFIIPRLEGKDLVVRCVLKSEYASFSEEQRIAMLRNVFNTDGLNHELRLIYRPEGVEVYQDFKYLGLARWRDPLTVFKQAINCPKDLIETCAFASIPISITDPFFAYPDNDTANFALPTPGVDQRKWWDLFIGYPVNVKMYFKRVAVQELSSINHPDSIDFGTDLSGFEVEKYSFDFGNQAKDKGVYRTTSISVPCEFKVTNPFPAASGSTTALTPDVVDTLFSSYPDEIVTDLTLVSQSYLNSQQASFSQDVQNYFKLSTGEIVTIDNLFKENGWSPTLHKDYNYDNFNKVFDNYQIFSQQVLTYLSLLPFMELVENKFKRLISQFIPIVINISKFGRLTRQLEKQKVHYPNIHKICAGSVVGFPGRGSFRIVHGSNNEYLNTNNNLTIQIYSPTFTSLINFGTFNWNSSNSLTAEAIYNSITTAYLSTEISVIRNLNVIVLDVDPAWFLTTFALDINDCSLVITTNANVQVDKVSGFSGGVPSIPSISSGGCFSITVVNNSTITTGFPQEYIYYDVENALNTYIYEEGEIIGDGPYLYV